MEFRFPPTVGYLTRREDYDLGSIDTIWPYASDKKHTS